MAHCYGNRSSPQSETTHAPALGQTRQVKGDKAGQGLQTVRHENVTSGTLNQWAWHPCSGMRVVYRFDGLHLSSKDSVLAMYLLQVSVKVLFALSSPLLLSAL